MPAKKRPKGEPVDRPPKAKQEESLNQKLIKALAHPLRVRILAFMNDRPWSPRELEQELGEGLSQVSYHVKVLRDFELISLTKTEPRRGAVEHFYRATERAFIPGGMAKHIPKSGRRIMYSDVMEEIDKDVAASLKSGRFDERDDYHVSWTTADLDGKGREDAEKLCDEFVERYLNLDVESAKRRAESDGEPEHIPTSAALLMFGSEHSEKRKAPSRKPVKKEKKRKQK
jgi:DNA-binding transcriptional ArsR family regulator